MLPSLREDWQRALCIAAHPDDDQNRTGIEWDYYVHVAAEGDDGRNLHGKNTSGPQTHQKSTGAAKCGEYRRLGEEHAGDSNPARAERAANGDLLTSARGSRQSGASKVRACDDDYERRHD